MSEQPDHTNILDQLEQIDGWSIDDWEFVDGNNRTQTLSIELERIGQFDGSVVTAEQSRRARTIKDVIANLERENDEGAPIDEVLNVAVNEHDWNDERVKENIEKLRRLGEVYEPIEGKLRTT